MKRLVSNKSWKENYGQKWQNIESSMESESNDDDLHSSPVESTVTPQIFDIEAARQEPSTSTTGDEENKIPKGKRVGGRTEGESMYRAALVGDWKDAEKLLGRDPKLAFDYVTEEGDRALHVAAAMKHKYFVQKLIKRMSDNDLMLLDGRGYTACCYAAISGVVEIARFMIEKNRNLVTAHDEEKKTPLHKAAFRGNNKMLSYLLESTQVEDLSKKEWFDLLLVTIRGEMYGQMKRLSRTRSGRQIYGPKWQNIEGKDEIDDHSASIESTAMADHVSEQENQNQNWKGSRADAEAMYKSALDGDWLAAEVVLARDPALAHDQITEEGDRALHVAVARKHEEFVQKLVENMSLDDVALLDGHGYTACCYAAISGIVQIADIILKKNPSLSTARDKNGATPLHKATLHGNAEMVSYLLKCSKVEDLLKEEWFHLLLNVIGSKMYDVALELLEKDGSLATMRNEGGTALHHLARHEIADVKRSRLKTIMLDLLLIHTELIGKRMFGEMQPDLCSLAKKLWTEIQKLDRPNVLELIKNPPILHDAAKVGNVELILMLLKTYPDLIWDTDSNGYTIFHIAVIYRQECIFGFIHGTGAAKHFVTISQDENGDNILHLAAKLAHPNARKIVTESTIEMQREMVWFTEVEAIVPPPCLEMRNKDGHTPQELFSKEHKSLLEKGETWMRDAAHTCMLIATLLLTVVFAAAFQVPGGNNQDTGIPIHIKSKWFTCFIIFEAMAMFSSTMSVTVFWSIMTSSFEEDQFMQILPNLLKLGLLLLIFALVGSASAFMSAYFLVFVGVRAALIKSVIISVYVVLVYAVFYQFDKIWLNVILPAYLAQKLSRPVWRRRDMPAGH